MLIMDPLFVTFLVVVTSGTQSALAIFYLWPIVSAALLLGARACYAVTGLSTVLYLALAIVQERGWVPPDLLSPHGFVTGSGLGAALIRVIGFLLIALLTGMLSNALLQQNELLLGTKTSLEEEVHRLKAANRRLTVLDEMSQGLRRIQELDLLLPRAMIRLANFTAAEAGFLLVFTKDAPNGRIAARHNMEEAGCRALLSTGLPLRVLDMQRAGVRGGGAGRGVVGEDRLLAGAGGLLRLPDSPPERGRRTAGDTLSLHEAPARLQEG